jgi:hypothetical protein
VAGGCRQQQESPEDHTVRKLQEAMKAPPMMATPPDQTRIEHLANMATGQQAPGERTLSGTGVSVEAGPIHYQLTRASELQSVGGGDVKLTSTTPFVRVSLTLINAAGAPTQLDLSLASLGKGAERSGIAPDAQQVDGTRKLALTLAPHATEDVVLYFEAPAPQPPFRLHLPKPGGGEVELPVE